MLNLEIIRYALIGKFGLNVDSNVDNLLDFIKTHKDPINYLSLLLEIEKSTQLNR